MKVQSIYNSRILKKGLEFAADNSLLFGATVSFVLSSAIRSPAIMLTPDTDKENKRYACAKSLASGAINYLTVLAFSLPFSKAVDKINKQPYKYLKKDTIEALRAGEKTLEKSRRYNFAAQLFKLGLGFVLAAPKSVFTCALIPGIMEKLFRRKKENKPQVTFTGLYNDGISKLSKGIGKLMDTEFVQKLSGKFCNTNFEQHLMSLTDIAATGTFMLQTSKSKKIEETRKNALIYNAGLSTGMCVAGGYGLNRMLEKPADKFVKRFAEANKNSPKLEKYLQGIKVAKPAMILGGIYYIGIPLISTFMADKLDKIKQK